MVSGLQADIALILTLSCVVEAIRLLVIEKDEGGYKFRPLKWIRDSNLEPYQKTIVVSAVSLGILVVVSLLYRYVFKQDILGFIGSFSPVTALLYNLAIGVGGLVYYTYHIKEKKPDDLFWKLIVATSGLVLLFAQFQFGIFNGYI